MRPASRLKSVLRLGSSLFALSLGSMLTGCGPEAGMPEELGVIGETAQSLLINGDFESGPNPGSAFIQINAVSTALTGWTVTSGSIDLISASYWQPCPCGGSRSLDMNGVGPGTITQTFATTAGRSYRVDFSQAGNPGTVNPISVLRVSAAGQSQDFSYDRTNSTYTDMKWVRRSFTFTANSSSTTLSFASLTSTSGGPALDSVGVTAL